MKQARGYKSAISIVAAALFSIVGALLFVPVASTFAAGSTNNFVISSFDIAYKLTRDTDNRSFLEVTETITAEFPSTNQNHGIERILPLDYDNHPVNLTVQSVVDARGVPLKYALDSQGNGTTIVRIGDADRYVHGTQVYKIVYTQQDVTRAYADTQRDEWYWDTNGVGWQVPIQHLTVSATLGNDVQAALVDSPRCYRGVSRATSSCTIQQTEAGAFTVEAFGLGRGQNITIAFGFSQGTFAPHPFSLWETLVRYWPILLGITTVLGGIIYSVLVWVLQRRKYRTSETQPVVVEYIPPRGTSVTIASNVITPKGSMMSAQIIDLAVRHVIEIIEMKPKGLFRSAKYDIKVIADPSQLLAEEQEIMSDLFSTLPTVGQRVDLSSLGTGFMMRAADNAQKTKALIEQYGIYEKSPMHAQFLRAWGVGFIVFGILTLSPLVFILAFMMMFQAHTFRRLTDKGLVLRRYLMGLEEYIKAAEAERLKFLQGPDTAQKVGEVVDVTNPGQIVKLYERVLPYAILFGQEKQWTKRLSTFYESAEVAPSWFVGTAAFNAAAFSSAMTDFSSAVTLSSGASSSSGGSGGGGFSGGGGGGGGGGGW